MKDEIFLLNVLFCFLSIGLVIRMLQFLDKSLEHSEHTYLDFFAAELSDCISRLCSHDSNREYVRNLIVFTSIIMVLI